MAKKTQREDLADLTLLGKTVQDGTACLETFPNHHAERDYLVTLRSDEFTCLCPATGQPDFATISIEYIPDQKIVESKSLKLYLLGFRNEGIFQEHLVNVILDDLVAAMAPRFCRVVGEFRSRGGISIRVEAKHGSD